MKRFDLDESRFALFCLLLLVVSVVVSIAQLTDPQPETQKAEGAATAVVPPEDGVIRRVTVGWDAPTENEDGTPLTDLWGYRVYYGETSGTYTVVSELTTNEQYTILTTNRNHAYIAVTALDTSSNESDFSEELHWKGNVPGGPGGLKFIQEEPMSMSIAPASGDNGVEVRILDIPLDIARVDVATSANMSRWIRGGVNAAFFRADIDGQAFEVQPVLQMLPIPTTEVNP